MKYLIVGTGRCGTGYMSKIFNKSGIKCGHENVFTVKGPRGLKAYAADSSWLAVPFIPKYGPDMKLIVHIVRNPLKVFRSWLFDQNNVISLNPSNRKSAYNDYILKYFTRIKEQKNQVDKAIVYYLDCNNMIEEYCRNITTPYFLFRVEDDPTELMAKLNKKIDFNPDKYNKYNTRKKGKAVAEDVIPLIKESKYYGELKNKILGYYPELEEELI